MAETEGNQKSDVVADCSLPFFYPSHNKPNISSYLLLILVFLSFLPSASATDFNIIDASYTDSFNPDSNYGGSLSLYVSGMDPIAGTYLDLGQSFGYSVYLNIYSTSTDGLSISVYNTGSFSETVITYNNKPSDGSFITSFNPSSGWNNITLSSPSRYIHLTSAPSAGFTVFTSDEGGNRPYVRYFPPPPPPPPNTLSGIVTDSNTSLPITTAAVTVSNASFSTSNNTNAQGYYYLNGTGNGVYLFNVSASGYYPFNDTVYVQINDVLNFYLIPITTVLPHVVSGYVFDQFTSLPLPDVTVTYGSHSSVTDYTGYYSVILDSETTLPYALMKSGYVSQSGVKYVHYGDIFDYSMIPTSYPVANLSVSGYVSNYSSSLPIAFSQVSISSLKYRYMTQTDSNGYYFAPFPSQGLYTVRFAAVGYYTESGEFYLQDLDVLNATLRPGYLPYDVNGSGLGSAVALVNGSALGYNASKSVLLYQTFPVVSTWLPPKLVALGALNISIAIIFFIISNRRH